MSIDRRGAADSRAATRAGTGLAAVPACVTAQGVEELPAPQWTPFLGSDPFFVTLLSVAL